MNHKYIIAVILAALLCSGCAHVDKNPGTEPSEPAASITAPLETQAAVPNAPAESEATTPNKQETMPNSNEQEAIVTPPAENDTEQEETLSAGNTQESIPVEPLQPTGTESQQPVVTIPQDNISATDPTAPAVEETEQTQPVTTPPTEHIHVYRATIIAPTCVKEGYTNFVCGCGAQYDGSYTDALGHDYSDWVTIVDATTSDTGLETRECYRCGAEESREIPMLERKDEPVPASTLQELEAYGRSYAVCTYGYAVDISMGFDNSAYYPGMWGWFTASDYSKMQSLVRDAVDITTDNLIARSGPIWGYREDNGAEWHTRINVTIVEDGDGMYTCWVFYG